MPRMPAPRGNAATMDASAYVQATRRAQPRQHEEQAQRAVFARIAAVCATDPAGYVDLYYTHHSPNEQPSAVRRMRDAALGCRAGHPDLVNYAPRVFRGVRWAGCALELKIEPNTLSHEQDNYLQHLHRCGWFVEVVSAPDADTLADLAWCLLCDYLGIAMAMYAPHMSTMRRKGRKRR